MMNIRERVEKLLNGLCKGIYEKEEVIKLSFLTAVAGESIFLLGPPGVAKSLIARKLKFAFKDGKSFEYLMSRFSTPDEIFGPVSIKKLKDEDKYERLTNEYMPGANVVFLDEIWKAGPAIQNALLTILNEKIYRNGEAEEKVNIKAIISASNELPAIGEGLEALWDRFLIRYLITEIKERGNFINMISSTEDVYADSVDDELKISNEELDLWEEEINKVSLSDEVINTLQLIKHKLEEYNTTGKGNRFDVFDRRWKKVVKLLRTSAFLNGREEVDLMDCFLMLHCLWSFPDQIDVLKKIISETIRKHGYTLAINLTSIKKEIREFDEEIKSETKIPYKTVVNEPILVNKVYYEIHNITQIFDGKYVRHNDFEKLRFDEVSTIGLYGEEGNLTYKIKAKKSVKEHCIEVFHQSEYTTFSLKTTEKEKIDYIYKKPHVLVLKNWNERINNLQQYVNSLNKKLAEETPVALAKLRSNLFVDSNLSEIVEANMHEAIEALRTEKLKIEKLKFYYDNLE
ncbi:AAA family ATPase [Chondrinema litorale]|uniref:AAA family ATPase n=1 Tax=Chondrinema litorale TaxID=2994555 RepID=UPI002543F693|nr:AAA family ATPase [Chondrinema litorale]UZR94048.1 AAA family ATPase [Chondrinema litorale]